MNTCPECNRFLGDAGHARTCSKRGLSPVASDPLLAELIADIVRLDHESLLPDGDMVHVGTHSWAAEWVRRLTDAGIIPANAEAHGRGIPRTVQPLVGHSESGAE